MTATDAPSPTCGCMSLLRGRCVLPWCPSYAPQGTTTGLAEAPATEGLKALPAALRDEIQAIHARHPAPCELFTRKMGRCTCPPDPTEQETHP